jgi:23S rRNA (uracil1939-C5)-methyltransferase
LWNYRRKARLSVRWVEKKGRVLVGFRELNGRYVADIDQCHILDERIAGCLPQLAELVAGLAIFDRIPQLEVACGDQLAALIFRVLEPVSDRDAESLRTFAQNSGIAIFLQPGGPATITPLEPARVQLEYQIPAHSVRFEFGPANFVQVNAGLNQLMVDQVIKMLEPTASDRVVDLFCGLGNFSLPLARYAGSFWGLEGDSDLVDLARHNAGLNSMTNVHFDVADLAAARLTLPPDFASATKVLLDPPRSGAAGVIPAIAAGDANRLVYVSCNPVTLAEDAGQLVNTYGYRLEAAGIMDMFPHTAHIESCALFTR